MSEQCLVKSGRWAGLTVGWQDVDECLAVPAVCGGECTNTVGSYECSCPAGYRAAEGKQACQDVDECTEARPCSGATQHCHNTAGGYSSSCCTVL